MDVCTETIKFRLDCCLSYIYTCSIAMFNSAKDKLKPCQHLIDKKKIFI